MQKDIYKILILMKQLMIFYQDKKDYKINITHNI